MTELPLGKNQRDLLGKMAGIHMALVVGDALSASLVRRGLLAAEPDGSFARITPAGLRAVAAEMETGRLSGWSVERMKDREAANA